MNVLFINDSTSNTNWGDRAAATSLKMLIAGAGGTISHAVTEAELWASSFRNAPVSAGSSGAAPAVPEVDHRERLREFVKRCIPPVVLDARRKIVSRRDGPGPDALIPSRPEDLEVHARVALRESRFGWPDLRTAIVAADVAMIHGASMDGGGIFPRTILFLAYLIKRHFGVPVVIVNHTADLEHPELRRMAEAVYPLFDDVVFRDPISAGRCAALCAGRYAADSAFLFAPAARRDWAPIAGRPTYFDIYPHEARFDPAQPYLCLGGSSNLWSRWDPPALAGDFSRLIGSIRDQYAGQIVLTAADVPDQTVFELVAARLGLPLVGVTTPVQQAVDIVGNADAYIGGRWHPGIFALRGGTPVVALTSKTFKTRALMRAASLPEDTFDSLRIADQRGPLIALLRQHLDAGEDLRERLHAWADHEAENTWDNVAYLRSHAAKRETVREDGASATESSPG